MLLALAGGVGGAKLAYGMNHLMGSEHLAVAVNTGDDFRHLGLAISPDLDTVCYALAELDDVQRGWGRADETWRFMQALAALGQPSWFQLGDMDLAVHVTRTRLLAQGATLTEVTRELCAGMNVAAMVLPMSNEPVATILHTDEGVMEFQDYFVRRQCKPRVLSIEYLGHDVASVNTQILDVLSRSDLEGIVVCPSNPWLSIEPILGLRGLKETLKAHRVPVVIVSPIVGGQAVKGPAGKLMAEMGLEVSALGVAYHYKDLASGIVIDHQDAKLQGAIEALGMQVLVTDTLMPNRTARIRLASDIVKQGWI